MIRSLVVLPGRAPHWVADHARHLAQRLTEDGRVMVVFTHNDPIQTVLPGQPGNASVLGHSVSGYPVWTGRLSAALGWRKSGNVSVIVLWHGANHLLALWSTLVAKVRGEVVVVDIPEVDETRPSVWQRLGRRTMRTLAANVVQGEAVPAEPGRERVILALCGSDDALPRLLMQAFEGMSDETAGRWRLIIQVDPDIEPLSHDSSRRPGKVTMRSDELTIESLRNSDVLIADFGDRFEDYVHQAVLSGGAGVLVGQPVAGRIARCHDGVWLAQRDPASILVALEGSSGDISDRPGTVAKMRELANEVIHVVHREVAEAAA